MDPENRVARCDNLDVLENIVDKISITYTWYGRKCFVYPKEDIKYSLSSLVSKLENLHKKADNSIMKSQKIIREITKVYNSEGPKTQGLLSAAIKIHDFLSFLHLAPNKMKTFDYKLNEAETFLRCLKDRDNNETEAIYRLGQEHLRMGMNEMAQTAFKRASDLGHTKAPIAWAKMPSTSKALTVMALKKLADDGDADAMYILSTILTNITKEERDQYRDAALKAKHPEALFMKYRLSHPPDESLLEEAASKGSPEAQNRLWSSSKPGEFNMKYIQYLQVAVNRQDPEAEHLMGELYLNGKYIPKDPVKAFKHFALAVDHGHDLAYTSLGICYKEGIGVKKNPLKAFKNFQKYLETHDRDPQANLLIALCYLDGTGVTKDEKKGFEKLLVCENSYSETYKNEHALLLGVCYEKGIGTEKDINKAVGIYTRHIEVSGFQGAFNRANALLGTNNP